MTSPECYCGSPMRERKGKHGRFWGCVRYPDCDGVIGAHQETGLPMGIPADDATRKARIAAHAAFDELWRGKGAPFRRKRSHAYRWLARALGIRTADCHIAKFDAATCQRVVEACTALETEREERSA